MSDFVRELQQNVWGKSLVGLVAAVVLSALYWHFVPDTSVAKAIYVMVMLAAAYRYYKNDLPA